MAINLIPEIAKRLGVEIGEVFKVRDVAGEYVDAGKCITCVFDSSEALFRFTDDSLAIVINGDNRHSTRTILEDIVCGKLEIVKLPFNPKFGDKYWTYEDIACDVIEMQWHNDWMDYKNKKLGLVFRTKNEALMERPDCYEALTGHAWMVEG